jgi:hypothetical protein
MAEKPEFVVFMSPGCKFCTNFMKKLKGKPELLKKFNVVNVDKLQIIPDEVDEIPCVYDGKQVYQGKGAFKWIDEKLSEYLDAANDGCSYAFLEGQDELVFQNYSLLEQKNGSFGIGQTADSSNMGDPTRMISLSDNNNKNRTLDSIMASRSSDFEAFGKKA